MVTYKNRKSLFEKEREFKLADAGLEIIQEGKPVIEIPYQSIRAIRLFYMPSRANTENYTCKIECSQISYSFQSTSYVSLANFKNKANDYSIFTEAFITKVNSANPSVLFFSGKSKAGYYSGILFMLLMGFFVALAVFFLGNSMSSVSWVKFVLILLMIPFAYRYIRSNKPGTFTATNIPERLLPKN